MYNSLGSNPIHQTKDSQAQFSSWRSLNTSGLAVLYFDPLLEYLYAIYTSALERKIPNKKVLISIFLIQILHPTA
jgi:hypothetical protein